jgi:hypothetical protein
MLTLSLLAYQPHKPLHLTGMPFAHFILLSIIEMTRQQLDSMSYLAVVSFYLSRARVRNKNVMSLLGSMSLASGSAVVVRVSSLHQAIRKLATSARAAESERCRCSSPRLIPSARTNMMSLTPMKLKMLVRYLS